MKKLCLSIFTMLFSVVIYCQELPKITPLSPNAAAIAKYGEIPVGHFTGIPNINIPLYEIKSGSLNLPLSLSYHASGNKVEDIASWVGLGWSLNSIPIISRSIRGLSDFANQYTSSSPNLADEYIEDVSVISESRRNQILSDLASGEYDSEPDMFSYSLNGESGNFLYNRGLKKFITKKKSNIKIMVIGYLGNEAPGFKIISENGLEYTFLAKEKSSVGGQGFGVPSPPILTSSWRVTKIKNPVTKDSIMFNYIGERQIDRFFTPQVKYQWIYQGTIDTTPFTSGPNTLINDNSTQRLKSIIFNTGSIEFKEEETERIDLQGGHSLKEIIIKDKRDNLITKFSFVYKYKNGIIPQTSYDYSKNWLLLEKVKKTSPGVKGLTHSFEYNEDNFPKSRLSFAQDFLGYHNGKTSNTNLIPTISIKKYFPTSNNQNLLLSGANRQVNPVYSQFGILKKITYPTGGSTEFDFENNTIEKHVKGLPLNYTSYLVGIEQPDYNGGIPPSDYFEKTFSINNSPDLYLNNNNPNGGAFVDFTIGSPGCDISQGASACALFRVRGISSNNSHISYDFFLENTRNIYLPNGNYKMTAEFDQDPPQYENAYFTAKWQIKGPNIGYIVPGLRIKEIRSYPKNSYSTGPIIKKYKYVLFESTDDYTEPDLDSSGFFFSPLKFVYEDIANLYGIINFGGGYIYTNNARYLRIRSNNNIQQVNDRGTYVGYKCVVEETSNIDETGMTVYYYDYTQDSSFSDSFPFPPLLSNKIQRGNLTGVEYYKKNPLPTNEDELEYVLTKSIHSNYSGLPPNILPEVYSYGLKAGLNILLTPSLAAIQDSPNPDLSLLQLMSKPSHMFKYEISTDWNNLSKRIEKVYDFNGLNPITTTTNYFYDNVNHLQRTRIELTNSKGEILKTKIEYADEKNDTRLISENRIAIPLESITYKKIGSNSEKKLSTQNTIYKDFNGNYLPEKVQTSKGNSPLEDRVVYHKYDDKGNPTEVSKKDGTKIYYVWGYHQSKPIAKIEGYTSINTTQLSYINQAISASNIDSSRCLDSESCNEKTLRQKLTLLRNSFSLPNAQVTTYTYDPLIGVTSITDPRGNIMYYEYDSFHRLQFVKDKDGNILKENQYNYKN